MTEEEAVQLFIKWYVEPIEKLKDLPNGAGGWVAFMVALALYYRLITARLKSRGESNGKDDINVKTEMAKDLGLTLANLRKFWDMFRNGLLHKAMPKVKSRAGQTHYRLDGSYSGSPQFIEEEDGVWVVCIDPWKFADRVLREFLSTPKLITVSDSCPLANIIEQPPHHITAPQVNPPLCTGGAIIPQESSSTHSGGVILPQENSPTPTGGVILPQEKAPPNTSGTVSPYLVPPKKTDS